MEHDFYEEEEKQGSSKKVKRLGNKRERHQVKNYLKSLSPEDFDDDEDIEDLERQDVSYKN